MGGCVGSGACEGDNICSLKRDKDMERIIKKPGRVEIKAGEGKVLVRGDHAMSFTKAIVSEEMAGEFREVSKDDIPAYTEKEFEEEVVARIRQKYSVNEELATLRQRDTKPDEFDTYSAFVEECKVSARLFLAEGNREFET